MLSRSGKDGDTLAQMNKKCKRILSVDFKMRRINDIEIDSRYDFLIGNEVFINFMWLSVNDLMICVLMTLFFLMLLSAVFFLFLFLF